MTTDSLETIPADPVLRPATFEGTLAIAKVFAASGFFHDSRQEAQALVKIMAGRELGFPPFAAMTGIYLAESKNGRPARLGMHANLMAATVKRSGRYDYEVTRLDDTGCVLTFIERREGKRHELGVSAFTEADAKRAGLNSYNYGAFPRNMYFARSMSNGVKWYCPDVFGGPVYTPQELEEDPAPPSRPVVTTPEAAAARIVEAEVVQNGHGPTPEPASVADEPPPSYEAMAAINMVNELAGGRFDGKMLEGYFGAGVRNKTALDKQKAETFATFKAGFDRLLADHKAGKAGPVGVAA
jgi:hypothetical protein